jgi:predicted DNA-binding antitoxin AbrB/MazE fold protein
MATIYAVWRNGVFTPDDTVDLDEGIRVAMEITATNAVTTFHKRDSVPLPDPPIESEARPAPFDLPMPTRGEVVKAHDQDVLLPEAHDVPE